MSEQKKRTPKGKKPPRRREGFVRRTNAVHLTIWDGYGNVLPDEVATEVINTVNDISVKHGFLLSFTRE